MSWMAVDLDWMASRPSGGSPHIFAQVSGVTSITSVLSTWAVGAIARELSTEQVPELCGHGNPPCRGHRHEGHLARHGDRACHGRYHAGSRGEPAAERVTGAGMLMWPILLTLVVSVLSDASAES